MSDLLDQFIDLMARRPHQRGAVFPRDYSETIAVYSARFGVSIVKLSSDIARRRRALAAEHVVDVAHQVADPAGTVGGAINLGAEKPRVGMSLLDRRLPGVTLEIFEEVDISLADEVALRVRRQQERDEVLQQTDAPGQIFDLRPHFKIVIGGHSSASSASHRSIFARREAQCNPGEAAMK